MLLISAGTSPAAAAVQTSCCKAVLLLLLLLQLVGMAADWPVALRNQSSANGDPYECQVLSFYLPALLLQSVETAADWRTVALSENQFCERAEALHKKCGTVNKQKWARLSREVKGSRDSSRGAAERQR